MNLRQRARGDAARIFATGFAEAITFMPDGGTPIALRGIWKEGEQVVDTGDYLQVSSAAITVTVRKADLAGRTPVIGEDRIQHEGVTYTVNDVRPRHPDMLELHLHRRSA